MDGSRNLALPAGSLRCPCFSHLSQSTPDLSAVWCSGSFFALEADPSPSPPATLQQLVGTSSWLQSKKRLEVPSSFSSEFHFPIFFCVKFLFGLRPMCPLPWSHSFCIGIFLWKRLSPYCVGFAYASWRPLLWLSRPREGRLCCDLMGESQSLVNESPRIPAQDHLGSFTWTGMWQSTNRATSVTFLKCRHLANTSEHIGSSVRLVTQWLSDNPIGPLGSASSGWGGWLWFGRGWLFPTQLAVKLYSNSRCRSENRLRSSHYY